MNSIFAQHKKYILTFVLAVATLMFLVTSAPDKIFGAKADSRVVLSSLTFSPKGLGQEKYYVFKIIENQNIFLEIYTVLADGSFRLLSHIDTNTKYNGYFLLGGNATSLAFLDATDGSDAQILSPGFDKNLIAYLHVVRFNPANKSFTLLTKISP